jgi:Ca-activated chloride channel family protein
MSFIWPPLLLAVLLVPLGVWAARRIDERRRDRLSTLGSTPGRGAGAAGASAAGAAASAANASTPRRPASRGRVADAIPAALVIGAFLLFAVALARPEATLALPRVEGTVVLTFDVSASMAADDVSPTRMDVAKAAAKSIVEQQPPGVVVGVVAFSDAGLSVLPPTSEQGSILQAIERLAPSRGTSLGQGILASLNAINQAKSDTPPSYYSNRSAAPTPQPAPVAPGSQSDTEIVVLSDGENNENPDPAAAAMIAATQGIRVMTIGVGTTAGTTLDLDGFRVQTALDENLLKQVAALTKGTYQPAASLNPNAVYDQLAERLVARDEHIEITALVAGLGLVLLVAGVAVSLARTGRLP